MNLSVKEIEKVFGVTGNGHDASLRYVSIDSRQIVEARDTLFFALKGRSNDGHKYIGELYLKGVRNFVISVMPDVRTYAKANFFLVDDVKVALQQLAAYYRNTLDATVIGITGSNGKTVVKEWLSTMMRPIGKIAKSPKSYNSQIGVPLSIFQINKNDAFAILEAGISTRGEMEHLQKMILPDFGILTNIGSAHDEGFDNRIEKANEKLKLFKGAKDLIYCSDQNWFDKVELPKGLTRLNWTAEEKGHFSDVKFDIDITQTTIHITHTGSQHSFEVGFTDKSSLENIVQCICICLHLELSPEDIQNGLEQLYSVEMRLQMVAGKNQCILINDAYTADIESLQAGLDFQSRQGTDKTKTVIISDFLQMGTGSDELYKQIAELLNQYKVNRVIGIGQEVSALDPYMDEEINAVYYKRVNAFLEFHDLESHKNEIILAKGARRFRFEFIINRLMDRQHEAALQVDLSAMLHNVNFFKKKLNKHTKLLAMIKASGYGSGSVQVANLLENSEVDYFGVAYPDEGIALRKKGIQKPILVLNCPTASFSALLENFLEPEIYALQQLQSLIYYLPEGQSMKIHLKIETGMNRLGFVEHEWTELTELLERAKSKIIVQSLMTHLAASDIAEQDDFSAGQIRQFNRAYEHICGNLNINPDKHVLNTSGILRLPQYQYDMVRLGLGLYGIDPTNTGHSALKEVLSFKASISQIKQLRPGDTVGYSRAGHATDHKTIAIVNVGYADGLLRKAGNGRFKVLINGKLAPTVGNICMDMCMIDISDIDHVSVNDEVTIFGLAHSVENLCKALDTIPYEVYTGISERIKRVYFKD